VTIHCLGRYLGSPDVSHLFPNLHSQTPSSTAHLSQAPCGPGETQGGPRSCRQCLNRQQVPIQPCQTGQGPKQGSKVVRTRFRSLSLASLLHGLLGGPGGWHTCPPSLLQCHHCRRSGNSSRCSSSESPTPGLLGRGCLKRGSQMVELVQVQGMGGLLSQLPRLPGNFPHLHPPSAALMGSSSSSHQEVAQGCLLGPCHRQQGQQQHPGYLRWYNKQYPHPLQGLACSLSDPPLARLVLEDQVTWVERSQLVGAQQGHCPQPHLSPPPQQQQQQL
jgi:hypothetical protein